MCGFQFRGTSVTFEGSIYTHIYIFKLKIYLFNYYKWLWTNHIELQKQNLTKIDFSVNRATKKEVKPPADMILPTTTHAFGFSWI